MTHPFQQRVPLVDPIYCREHEQIECPFIADVSVPGKDPKPCHTAIDVPHDHVI